MKASMGNRTPSPGYTSPPLPSPLLPFPLLPFPSSSPSPSHSLSLSPSRVVSGSVNTPKRTGGKRGVGLYGTKSCSDIKLLANITWVYLCNLFLPLSFFSPSYHLTERRRRGEGRGGEERANGLPFTKSATLMHCSPPRPSSPLSLFLLSLSLSLITRDTTGQRIQASSRNALTNSASNSSQ